jgi:acylphosphatase
MTACIRCHVSGRVQGVWFRASTQEQAERLGISGYAHNLADGRVEVLACGEREALLRLRDWLQLGPRGAQVTALECEHVEITPPLAFTTG